MPPTSARRVSAAALTAALDAGGLEVVYQPVVQLATGRVVAAEALARLRLPRGRSLLPPSLFLPVAERYGLVGRIDAEVAEIAVRQAVAWRALLPGEPFSIGLNVSVEDLDDSALPHTLSRLCADAGLPVDALVIEITETVLSREGRGHEDVLRSLAALGANVTLDDFGTGYSSIAHLRRFPVKGIKIDRSFTWDLERDPRLTTALVRFGNELGVHVVAEGVETPGQLQALADAGCPFVQGYLLSPPVPAAELTALLHHRFDVPLGRTGPVAVPLPRRASVPSTR